MTPQELKNSILQLAIQGKLVEQRLEEGTAEELYQQIQAEKQRLIKEGKLKKEKPLPEITEDEKPFDIPESWKWVRLGEISQLLDGNKLNGPSYPYLEAKYLRGIAEAKYLNNGRFITKGTWAILVDGENSGEVFEIKEDGYLGSTFKVLYISGSLYSYYVLFFLSLHKAYFRNNKKGAAIPHLNKELFFNMTFPLPPLAEQKRIVAKIEELLPYVDRYEKAWNKLEELNKRFPTDLQKSILQLAIQGKLVEQRPEEGTAEELYQQIQAEKQRLIKEGKLKKEKPLPEITEDEMPFDIPENWKWVRLSDVVDVRDGTHDTPKYVSKGVPLVTSKNLVNGSIDFETAKLISFEDSVAINMRSAVDDGDILFAMIGTIGNPVLVKKDREFSIKNMALFKKIDETLFDMSYLLFFLQREQDEMKKVANASVQSFVSLSFLRKYLIPLPPLSEQKRIVKKLEEILPLCEKLKK
jgi:type I restriction enzyme S subunit